MLLWMYAQFYRKQIRAVVLPCTIWKRNHFSSLCRVCSAAAACLISTDSHAGRCFESDKLRDFTSLICIRNLPNFHCKFVTFARNYTRMNRVASLHLKVRKENFHTHSTAQLLLMFLWLHFPSSMHSMLICTTSFPLLLSRQFSFAIFSKKKLLHYFFTLEKAKGCLCNLNYSFNFFLLKYFSWHFLFSIKKLSEEIFLHWLKIHFSSLITFSTP